MPTSDAQIPPGISSSLEDYLEAIAEIIATNDHAHTKDIADRLNVSMPSVTSALQALSARGLLRYERGNPVTLTEKGAMQALKICRRHTVLKQFFENILKLDETEADRTACAVEHILNDNALARIETLTDSILHREECQELRKYLEIARPENRQQ